MKTLGLSLIFASGLLAAGAPANAQSSYILYNTIYYSDASHETVVGRLIGSCGRYFPQYRLVGSQSPYSEEYEVGMCNGGGLEPIG